MQIIVVSDSHGRNDVLVDLIEKYPDASYFLHCGDVESMVLYPPYQYVRGNNDFMGDFPNHLVVKLENHRIYVTHSHRCNYYERIEELAELARENKCDIVCYGHTHIARVDVIDGITILNPGSLWRSRDGKPRSYAVLTIEDEKVDVEHIYLEDENSKDSFSFW